ncbi:hypothetical protein COOONC_15335 [Cooperia oncophora]
MERANDMDLCQRQCDHHHWECAFNTGLMDWLENVFEEYGRVVHPPLVLILCISGSLGHLVSIATLSSMMNPTNAFLISMSWLHTC